MNELKINPKTDLNELFKNDVRTNTTIVVNEIIERFQPPIRKAISINQTLSKILKVIEPINFEIFLEIS